MPKHQQNIKKFVRAEKKGILRAWCFGLGVFSLCLALLAVSNPLANPESWISLFSFFQAMGLFENYAIWFVSLAVLFILFAVILPYKR